MRPLIDIRTPNQVLKVGLDHGYDLINPLIKGTVSTWVALCFICVKHTVLCHLETIYYERGDSQLSFAPKIFNIGHSRVNL